MKWLILGSVLTLGRKRGKAYAVLEEECTVREKEWKKRHEEE